jgi:hypothetical protein
MPRGLRRPRALAQSAPMLFFRSPRPTPGVVGVLVTGVALLVSVLRPVPARAHSGSHPSVHDTVAGILERVKRSPGGRERTAFTRNRVESILTDSERHVLATGHLTFRVDQPVLVTVFHDQALDRDPFWLRDGTWSRPPEAKLGVGDATFDFWQKEFPAGEIGLGVNSLGGGARHYFVALRSLGGGPVTLADGYPGQLRATNFVAGARPWTDRTEALPAALPDGFAGQTLVQTLHAWRDAGRLFGRVQWTEHPASSRPDQVVLTWSDDPRTTQTIQWRTSRRIARGEARVIEAGQAGRPLSVWSRLSAFTTTLVSESTANDPVVHRHTVVVRGLRPGTRYAYRVGDGSAQRWSETREFVTAPAGAEPFAFVYMGDAQNGLDTWGKLVRGAYRARPDAAFYLMAGDLVNRGNERDDWDDFFDNARGVFDRRPLVPVVGNHECQGGRPRLFLEQFALPRNGPAGLEAERVYAFEYGSALFVVLDSNEEPGKQAAWLEDQLARSRARWKIVSYHHPAYSSAASRDNQILRETWAPIFDRHGVDLALQGHDHAYLRTYPIRDGRRAPSTAQGTTYIVSVSGTKFYKQAARPETIVGFTDIPTWQILDLEIAGDRLTYRAFDRQGTLRDEFVIDKGTGGTPAAPDAP